jgi:hypothetical protein
MVNEFDSSKQSYGQTTPVQQSRPPQNRPMQYNYPPSRGYVALIIVGIIILLVGGIIFVSIGFLEPKYEESTSMYSSSDSYTKEYKDNRRIITTLGNVFEYIGVILLSIGLTIGAIKDDSLPGNTKLGMLIAMGLIVGFKVGGFFNYMATMYI